MENSGPPRPNVNFMPALWIGILGTGLLGLLCLIVVGGLAYLRGYSLPTPVKTFTPAPTVTPLPAASATAGAASLTPSAPPTNTATATATFPPTFIPTATFIYYTPTFLPTRTRTPIPAPTKTFTPTPTRTPVLTTIHDTNYAIAYNSWIGLPDQFAYGRGLRCSSHRDEYISFETPQNTLKLSVFFFRGPNQGKAKIIVDGALADTIDLYKNNEQYQFQYDVPIARPKNRHTIRIVVLREKRNASSGYQVCFDGFKLNNRPVDDNFYGIHYDSWAGTGNGHAVGGVYRSSSLANSTVTFDIVGPAFDWITARGPNFGQAQVFVDDQLVLTVDLYFRAMQWNHSIHVQNLGNGGHTVKIVVVGQHHPSSNGDRVVFDGFRVP